MRLSLTRSVVVLLAIGVPAAAGGVYALSQKKVASNCPSPSAKERSIAPCACCTDGDETLETVAVQSESKDAGKSDSPMYGGTPQRNMVNTVDRIPSEWSVEEGKTKNIKWVAELGDKAYGGPVIAGGRVYVGTNNSNPRDPKDKGVKSVLMAFNEADGKFLWQITHQTPPDDFFKQGLPEGLCSTPIVEGDGIFYVTPGCLVVRADPQGKIVWSYDMMKELKVIPFHLANCSPVIVGDLVMVVTSNGVDEEGKLPSPKAPSFIAINKTTGKLAWQSALPGENIIEGQWSNPSVAIVAGKPQVIFPGGDGVLYSFEPANGELIWKFNCHPKRPPQGEDRVPLNYFVATPVIVGDRLYIGMGVGPELGTAPKTSHVLCIDVTKKGDVSPKSFDVKDPSNKDSALVWSFGGAIEPKPKKGRQINFGPTISTCAVIDGQVYIAEEHGFLHCLDAKTGQRLWFHDLKAAAWGSAYAVDGKVLIGVEGGTVFVFEQSPKKNLLAEIEMNDTIQTTPVAANGTLYVMTRSKLYAIAEKK
jgi:outer membrane protein assembly factor BamB